MIPQNELVHIKGWKLRKMLAELRKGYQYAKTHKFGMRNLMLKHYETDIPQLERELDRRRDQPR